MELVKNRITGEVVCCVKNDESIFYNWNVSNPINTETEILEITEEEAEVLIKEYKLQLVPENKLIRLTNNDLVHPEVLETVIREIREN